jgi:Chlorite dismutase
MDMAINPARFRGADIGQWRVTAQHAVAGAPLPPAPFVEMRPALDGPDGEQESRWVLRGTNSHVRYSERAEVEALAARKALLNRPEAICAALIPIRKSEAWWQMAQDDRRRVMEAESHHIAKSIAYLPAIARRIYHCRDLVEPFDFLTWFEFAPGDANRFDDLVATLRATPEWAFVDREVDIRLQRC